MYLLTITNDEGEVADVDVDLDDLDLSTPEGQTLLADAVKDALASFSDGCL